MSSSQAPGEPQQRRDPEKQPPHSGRPVRRRPRMVPFLTTGAVLGALLGVVIMLLGPDSPMAGPAQELIVLAVTGAILGALVGALAFLAAERVTRP